MRAGILGIGVDIVDINRVRHWYSDQIMMDYLFTKKEQLTIKACRNSERLVASFFAVKEAVFKASNGLLSRAGFRDIEIIRAKKNCYTVKLKPEYVGEVQALISLSFTSEIAMAKAVLLKR